MVTITGLDVKGTSVCISLNSGEKYWLKKSDLIDSGFTVGIEMTSDDFYHFIRIHQYPRALNQAVSMLARRPCSKGEILARLQRSRYMSEVSELVIYKLEKENLLNDRDFCMQWVQYRISRKYGPAVIRRELRMKGIPDDMIQLSLDLQNQSEELSNASALAAKAWSRMKPDADLRATRQRVITSLVRKGYSWDMARKACDEAEKNL